MELLTGDFGFSFPQFALERFSVWPDLNMNQDKRDICSEDPGHKEKPHREGTQPHQDTW